MAQGPQFVQYFGPVLDALRDLGGSARPEAVRDHLIRRMNLGEETLGARTATGQPRFDNQVAWARFYLAKAGLIDASRRGVWSLSDAGQGTFLEEDAALRLFRDIHAAFKPPADEGEEGDRQTDAAADKVEGAGEEHGIGSYPIDALLIRSEPRTVHEVVRRINQGFYKMDPDFQREFLWPIEKQSRLIESTLMRIPLPVIYLAEDVDGKLVVVDGLQRLTTFRNFLGNEFRLNLDNPDLDGQDFAHLPPRLQNRIEDASLIIYLIDSKVPERARLDIFERVNSGVPLTRQQMRNSLYQGKSTLLLRQLAQDPSFLRVTGSGLDHKSMRDREAINRFCAFYVLGVDRYIGDMDTYLADSLRKINTMTDAQVAQLRDAFLVSMTNNEAVFGEHAFRKQIRGVNRRSVINMSLFDVASVAFARLSPDVVRKRQSELLTAFLDIMEDEKFLAAISLGTSGRTEVASRFTLFDKMVQRVIDGP